MVEQVDRGEAFKILRHGTGGAGNSERSAVKGVKTRPERSRRET